MKVFLIRHSLAVEARPGLDDASRYLSELGRERARTVGEHLRHEGVGFDSVLTSPLPRAVQTAELIAAALGFDDVVTVLPALAPGVRPEPQAEQLSGRGARVAVVGHAPGISDLGALLVSRPAFPPLRPCQVSVVEGGQPSWTLNPETLELERLLVA